MAMQKTFPLFQLISHFSHLFMNIDIPSEDDGVLTAASDDRIEATFSFHFFWAFSLQAIFVQQKLFLFLLLDFFLTQPHCQGFAMFFCCKKFCEIVLNNPLEVGQITLLKLPRRDQNSKTTKNPNVMMDGCVCECTLFIYNKSSLLVFNPVHSHSKTKYSTGASTVPQIFYQILKQILNKSCIVPCIYIEIFGMSVF